MHANKPEMAKKWEKEKNEMKKMQIKGSELKQIVQEELGNLMLDEGFADWAMGVGSKIGSAAKSAGLGGRTQSEHLGGTNALLVSYELLPS